MISGLGLASARISGSGAICFSMLGLQHAARREAEEDVGPGDHLRQRPRVGLLREDRLPAVHQLLAALVDDALEIGDPDVAHASRPRLTSWLRQASAAAPAPRRHDLDLRDVLARQHQRIGHRRADDHRRAVLVVMEDRNVHALAQLLLDLEALGRLDVLEVDAAEGGLQRRHGVDEALDVVSRHLDVEDVDVGEFLEEHRLALHHRLGGQRPDVAQPQHRRAVGDDAHEIGAAGVFRHQRRDRHGSPRTRRPRPANRPAPCRAGCRAAWWRGSPAFPGFGSE